MSHVPDYKTTVGDELDLQATLSDSAGTVFSLAGASVKLNLRNAATREVILDGASAEITDEATARVRYKSTPNNLTSPGIYHAQFVVQFPNGGKAHFPRPLPLVVEVADAA
jgi:hypothetical protein